MRRLIKKAKFRGFLKTLNTTTNLPFEVYYNPTKKEIDEIKKQSEYGGIRGIIDDIGITIWPGDITHDQVNAQLYLPNDMSIREIDVNQFRFAYEAFGGAGLHWTFDAHEKYTFDELVDIILTNINTLSRIGNLNDDLALINHTTLEMEWTCGEPLTLYDLKQYKQDHNYFDSEDY